MEPIKKEWVTGAITIDNEVVSWAERTGQQLARGGLTSSNIRRFFGEMRRIQSDFKSNKEDVPLLKAKLAYDVGRKFDPKNHDRTIGIKDFYEVLAPGIMAINGDEKNFNRFVKIAESLVAFHKLYAGKNDD